jgi:hypothetical protein
MSKLDDIIFKVVLPEMAAHVLGLSGFLALQHLALITMDQSLFKGVLAGPIGRKRRKERKRSIGDYISCDEEGGDELNGNGSDGSFAGGDCCFGRDFVADLVVAEDCSTDR